MPTTCGAGSRRLAMSLALASLPALFAPSRARAARGETLLMSRASGAGGATSAADSFVARISADGRFVVFESNAQLTSDAVNHVTHVYMRDAQTSTTTLVSRATGPAGADADDDSGSPTVSADGRYVVFQSGANNLSPDDNDIVSNVFVRDTVMNTTILVSRATGPSGMAADGGSNNPAISADGRYVAFDSTADDLSPDDDNTFGNVFVRDLLMNTTTLVSRANGPTGAAADSNSSSPSISADGRYVAFHSDADDLSPDDNNAVTNVFVRDTLLGTTTLVSRANGPAGAAGDGSSSVAAISGDGRYVVFQSEADNLSADDNNALTNVFVRDLMTGTTTLVNRADGAGGAGSNKNSDDPSISADGRFVVFESTATNLGPATDSFQKLFERDLQMNTTTLVSRANGVDGAPGDDDSYTYGFVVSGDGRYVAVESKANNLSSDDNDAFESVYRRDVRGGPPHCSDVTQTVVREDPSAVALTCTDDDGDPVTRTIVTGPSHGSTGAVDQAAGTVGYTPNPGYTGPDSFSFQASDASGSSPVSTATLTVAGCTVAATFASVKCRLDELSAAEAAGLPAGRLATKLAKLLGQARTGITAAEGLGHTRKARKSLGKAAKALGAFGHALGTKAAKKLDPATVASLKAAAAALRQDIAALRG
jgi:Tol biopolymer transport system component